MNNELQFRYRIKYAESSVMQYTGHLDTLRAWERTFRRAQLPLAYTLGFNPRPRINIGLALPLGFTSDCELMDIWLTEERGTHSLLESIQEVLPPGLEIQNVIHLDQHTPTLQNQIHEVMYSVHLDPFPPVNQLQHQIETLLSSPEILRERRGKTYDLRPLITLLELLQVGDETILNMCLSAQEGKTGRPDEVLLQLSIDPIRAQIHRKKITLMDPTKVNLDV